MATGKTESFERTRAARGIKAAAFVLILGSVALAADQLFFVAPQPRTAAPVPTAAAAPPAVDGFALPDHLRHPTADATASAPTF